MALICNSKLAGHKPALAQVLCNQLWVHGFHIRNGWGPDGSRHRWEDTDTSLTDVSSNLINLPSSCIPAFAPTQFPLGLCIKAGSSQVSQPVQSQLYWMHKALGDKLWCCKTAGAIFPFPQKGIFFFWNLILGLVITYNPQQPFFLTWSRALGIGIVMLSHWEYTCAAWAFLYHRKTNLFY